MPTLLNQMVSLGAIRDTPIAALSMSASRTTSDEELADREGYDRAFLAGFAVDLPNPVGARSGDEAPLLDGSGYVLHYEHFSLAMSKSRRVAMFTACNIDGAKSTKIHRDRDVWAYDGRVDTRYQVGEDLYAGNRLDRGHLVRREDPVWGRTAQIANDDTFHFTNCSPQYDQFNQQLWLGLENYLLKNSRAHRLQISVFTGPVFRSDDMTYRGVQIPREYWKVVCLVTADQRASATAYKISQDDLLAEGLAFVFGKYKTYQVSVRHVEKLASLDFSSLRDHDGFSTHETMTAGELVRELTDWRDIMI